MYRNWILIVIAFLLLLPACSAGSGGANARDNARRNRPVAESIEAVADANTGIIWQADFETGNLSQIRDGGRITISGRGKANITEDVVHSGQYAAALTIFGANGLQKPSPGVRLAWHGQEWVARDNARNLPDEAYYSSYYYFPEVVETNWWNIMQWKQAFVRGNGSQSRNPTYFVSVVYANGVNTLILRSKVDRQGRYTNPGTTAAEAGIPLPTNRWVHVECYYRWSKAADGQIRCWQDGQQVWNVRGIPTEFGDEYNTYPRQWTVNNYAAETNPVNPTIYVDDLVISLNRQRG